LCESVPSNQPVLVWICSWNQPVLVWICWLAIH